MIFSCSTYDALFSSDSSENSGSGFLPEMWKGVREVGVQAIGWINRRSYESLSGKKGMRLSSLGARGYLYLIAHQGF